MVRTSTARIGLGVAAVALAVIGTIATSPSASAAKPDTTVPPTLVLTRSAPHDPAGDRSRPDAVPGGPIQ